ncbi:hypothetical protein [Streptomyces sp. NPDC096339]|uniref:hypothetical protein n=1 Tax=Streptomyces sp. NPDC096339 TaxID=3366086 RepID=UPI00381015FC
MRRFMEPPRDAVLNDRYVRVLQGFRFWGGLGIALFLRAPALMRHEGDWIARWALDGLVKLLITPVLLLAGVPLVVGVFIACARPVRRTRMRAKLRGPLIAVAAFLGHIVPAAGGVVGMLLVVSTYGVGSAWSVLALLGCVVVAGRGAAFVWFAVPAISRHMFRTVEVHQALPALLTVVLAWELVIQGSLFSASGPSDHPWLPVGGALATTAVAVFEIHRLATRHGIRLRG